MALSGTKYHLTPGASPPAPCLLSMGGFPVPLRLAYAPGAEGGALLRLEEVISR